MSVEAQAAAGRDPRAVTAQSAAHAKPFPSGRLAEHRRGRSGAPLASRVPSADGSLARRLDRLAGWLTAAVVALCPLPFGSTDQVWVATWSILLAVALLGTDTRRIRAGHLSILAPLTLTAVLFLALVAIQVFGTRSAPDELWARAQDLLGGTLRPSVSLNVSATVRALSHPILVFLAFTCAFLHSIERDRARLITAAALYSGFAYALIGIAQTVFTPQTLLWTDKVAYVGDLTGTFVNRNTAGTYFGCCLLLWTVRLVSEFNRSATGVNSRFEGTRTSVFDHLHPRVGIDLFCGFCCLAALLLTHSRAGVLFSLFAVMLTLVLQIRAHLPGRSTWIVASIAIVFVGALILELLGGGVAARLVGQGVIDPERLRAYGASLSIIADFPLFGTGLGTFPDVFPIYRGKEMSSFGIWDLAHSVPLELAVELGLPMTAVILALWLAGLFRLARMSLASRRGTVFVLASFGAGLLGSLHALVDFSPQIPGFAVFWVALLGCGLAQSVRRSERKQPAFAGFDRPATQAASGASNA